MVIISNVIYVLYIIYIAMNKKFATKNNKNDESYGSS